MSDPWNRQSNGKFGKGNCGGPGRLLGVPAIIRSLIDPEDLVRAHVSVALGEPQEIPKVVKRADGTLFEVEGLPDAIVPDLDDRAKSRTWLLDHLFGKAPERVELTGAEGEPFDPATLSDDELASYARLAVAVARNAAARGAPGEGREGGDPPAELPKIH